jgi:SAM-dependent methyltransferase
LDKRYSGDDKKEREVSIHTSRGCPICNRNESNVLFDHVIENFDGVTFSRHVLIVSCDNCGAVYNDTSINAVTLKQYYQNDALYSGETGSGSGGTMPADVRRYSCYLKFLNPVLSSKDIIIVDVGCAKGGFLSFLKDNGFTKVSGVEIDPKCAEYARHNFGLNVKNGLADCLPFDSGDIEVLVYNHVLEHLHNPLTALKEARRVLRDDGMVFIEVPDASRYSEGRVFDYFWFCIREHINHFDLMHLTMLMELAGFVKIDDDLSLMPSSSHYYYPSLFALFRKSSQLETTSQSLCLELSSVMRRYIDAENDITSLHRDQIEDLSASGRPVYIWGISLEFFSLYSLAGLRDCNIHGLIDRNLIKQSKTVNGVPIVSPESLRAAPPEVIVVITSVFNKNEMLNYLKEIGFKGQVMTFDCSSPESFLITDEERGD